MNFANKISLSRILIIPFFVASLFCYTQDRLYLKWICVGIFFFTMLSDLLDGLIARLKGEKTVLGKILDPIADKLFLINSFVWIYHLRDSLPIVSKLPWIVLIIVLSRDLLIILGIIVCVFLKIDIKIEPNIWGKLTTFSQMSTILLMLLDFTFIKYVWVITCIFTIISGLIYIKRGVKVLNAFDKLSSRFNN